MSCAALFETSRAIPGETRKPTQTSGVRFGTAALTTRGATEAHMRAIAIMVADVANDLENRRTLARVRRTAEDLARELTPV